MSDEHGVWLDYVEVVKITSYIKTNGFHCAWFESKDLFRVEFLDHELHNDHHQARSSADCTSNEPEGLSSSLCFK